MQSTHNSSSFFFNNEWATLLIFDYLEGHYIFVASVCKIFHKAYCKAHMGCRTVEMNSAQNVKCIEWTKKHEQLWNSSLRDRVCDMAAWTGHLEVLQWVHSQGCPWDGDTCSYAAMNGHLEVLQWAHSQGCPWDEKTCAYAAENGHLEVLQWAHSQGCPWDEDTCKNAAMNGHLEVLQWAVSQGCPLDEDSCFNYAMMYDQPEVLKWAYYQGYHWNQWSTEQIRNS